MKQLFSGVLSLALAVQALASSAPDYASDRIFVKLRNFSFSSRNNKLQGPVPKVFTDMNTTLVSSMAEIGWHEVVIPKGQDPRVFVSRFKARKEVQNATLIYKRKADLIPNDTDYNKQYAPAKVHLPEVWDLGTGSTAVKIAIIDTGTDLVHPEFAGRIIPGFDFVNNDNIPQDDEGHGTHCSGIAAATGNNGSGIAGATWQTKIMPVKVLGADGSGSGTAIIQGILFAANNGVDVISMSLGGPSFDQAEQDACTFAWNKGIMVFATAGNNGDTVLHYPGAYQNVCSVAATDANDQMASFSTHGDWVDVAAPGVDIWSTLWNNGSTYGSESGTSMSCPLVAGCAALLKSLAPDATNADIISALEQSADKVGNFVIWGRINVLSASDFVVSSKPTETDAGSGVTVFGGGNATAPGGSLSTANDGNVYTIVGQSSDIGSAAMADLTISLGKAPAKVRAATFSMAVNANQRAAVAIWFYNWNTQKWEPLKSVLTNDPNLGTDTMVSIPILNVDRYVNATNPSAPVGTVKIRVRANMSTRRSSQSLTFGIDQAGITARLLK